MRDLDCDIAIIGAGIVGLAVGLQLTRRHPQLKLLILEKETKVAAHQTGHNSGVLHSGLYYKPGSLKARLCVEGRSWMVNFCREHGIPVDICGKVIVATAEEEFPLLRELVYRGEANGVAGLRELDASQIRELEPHVSGLRGIHVPATGITDFARICYKLAELLEQRNCQVLTGHEVKLIKKEPGAILLETAAATIRARYMINCAGLHSDSIARMTGADLGVRIVPFRGEYYELIPSRQTLVRNLVYPVADPRFPFLGVHFTRRIGGGIEAGPNAVFSFKREGYSRTSFSFEDTLTSVFFQGFWRMAGKHWRTGLGEMHRSWNKKAFTRALQKLLPELQEEDLQPGGSGVRAQAIDRSGKLLDDFYITSQDRILHVLNVPSPAATASLVIAREIVSTLEQTQGLSVTTPGASPIQ
jgi:L-2-hydroxyglutarate oxidase LhgO